MLDARDVEEMGGGGGEMFFFFLFMLVAVPRWRRAVCCSAHRRGKRGYRRLQRCASISSWSIAALLVNVSWFGGGVVQTIAEACVRCCLLYASCSPVFLNIWANSSSEACPE